MMGSIRPRGPSYIPADTFSRVLVSLLKESTGTASAASAVANLPDSALKRRIGPLVAGAETESEMVTRIGEWFDQGMDRVTGWYRRRSQYMLFGIGLVLAVSLDINSIQLFENLQKNDACRTQLLEQATQSLKANESESQQRSRLVKVTQQPDCSSLLGDKVQKWLSDAGKTETKTVVKSDLCGVCLGDGEARDGCANICKPKISIAYDMAKSSAPSDGGVDVGNVAALTLGYLITAFAISLGAPFWIDGMKMLISIRGAGPKPERVSAGKTSPANSSGANGVSVIMGGSPGIGFEAQLTNDDVKDLQAVLGMKLKYMTGVIDVWTRAEIEKWQDQNGSPRTGLLTELDYARIMTIP